MPELLFVTAALAYLLVAVLLFIFGVNFFYLTWLALRRGHVQCAAPPVAEWPRVTVQLPIYNELYVAERLIGAVAQLDYPAALLDIQVLDDSSDETVEIVRREVEHARARGLRITHVRRPDRAGYKAGALAYGMGQAQGEFVAIFDADFIPPPAFLRRVLPHFADPCVAFVQTRWGHVNRDYSLVTFLQSLAIDGHFMVEQFARSQAGYLFNFNGTAGVWRSAALNDAGGWTADTLTEDLDLSYRAFLCGWRALYLRDVEVPAELPASFVAYRRQQHRWARGSFECALKLLPRVWRAPLSLPQKVQATLHLTGYGVHLLLFALVLLYPLVLAGAARFPELPALFGLALVFNLTAFAPTVVFTLAQQQLGRRWWLLLPAILLLSVLGAGMMLNTVRAALEIVLQRGGAFERTPKFGLSRRGQPWAGRRYQLGLDPIICAELALALLNLGTVGAALASGSWAIVVHASLFSAGLFFTSLTTLAQALAVRRSRGPIIAAAPAVIP